MNTKFLFKWKNVSNYIIEFSAPGSFILLISQVKFIKCLKYKMSVWSRKCGYYIRSGIKYNAVEISSSDFIKIKKKRSRIDDKLRATRASLSENLAKINRFKKQQTFLRKREGEMIRRNIKNIKTLEKLKKEERLKKERINANTVATSEPTGTIFSSIPDDWIPSPSLLRDLEIS